MKITITPKDGVSLTDALNALIEVQKINRRIEEDIHTNKHYELRNGRIWHKGDATGKYWELLCNSHEAQRKAHEMMRI